MKKIVMMSAAIVLAGSGAPASLAENAVKPVEEMTKGEKKLAKLTAGRVAGEPVNCIRTFPNDRLTVIDDTAYVYGRGKTIYVQRTNNPDRIDHDDVLVTRRFSGTQLCRQDIVTRIDRVSGIFSGAVFMTEFVPYTRVEADQTS